MKRAEKLQNPEDYEPVITKEVDYYRPMAAELGISDQLLRQAAELGVRDGIYRHRENPKCKWREEECVAWNMRHFIDLTLVRAALLASNEEEMDKAEAILMKLIED
jgi:hypothetical protein